LAARCKAEIHRLEREVHDFQAMRRKLSRKAEHGAWGQVEHGGAWGQALSSTRIEEGSMGTGIDGAWGQALSSTGRGAWGEDDKWGQA
jgi:hypothetical protein